jgi:phage antirepressor YoqD-like protein
VAKLIEEGILYRLAGKLTPATQHMDAGRFEVKEIVAKNDHATTQMRFTTKGVEWIAGKVQDWNLGKSKA